MSARLVLRQGAQRVQGGLCVVDRAFAGLRLAIDHDVPLEHVVAVEAGLVGDAVEVVEQGLPVGLFVSSSANKPYDM